MPYPVKCLLKVYEDMVDSANLQVFLAEDPEIEYLFCVRAELFFFKLKYMYLAKKDDRNVVRNGKV